VNSVTERKLAQQDEGTVEWFLSDVGGGGAEKTQPLVAGTMVTERTESCARGGFHETPKNDRRDARKQMQSMALFGPSIY